MAILETEPHLRIKFTGNDSIKDKVYLCGVQLLQISDSYKPNFVENLVKAVLNFIDKRLIPLIFA